MFKGVKTVNELTNKKFMSTQEMAKVLQVGESTVKRAVEKLRPVLGGLYKSNQGGYMFDERQTTLIKQEIQSHHNLQSRQIDNVSTELEEDELIVKSMQILNSRIKVLRKQLEEQQHKVDLFDKALDCTTTKSMGDVAKMLNLGRNRLFQMLREKSVLMASNIPYQTYIERGYFKVVESVNENTKQAYSTTRVTQKGIDFINKVLNK